MTLLKLFCEHFGQFWRYIQRAFTKEAFMNISKFALGIAVILAVSSSPALADKGGKHKSHESRHYNGDNGGWRDRNDDDVNIKIAIGSDDRDIIRHYLREDAFRHCPPGLAKKNPPCIPPGQAKKWRLGYPLEVGFIPVPDSWGLRPPSGHQYVQVDKDVLLIAEAGHHVIDAVTLLSAVGN
jgi:hypothetical protein